MTSEEIRLRWKHAKEGNANWREEAAEAYKFVSGNQWVEDDKTLLEEEGRPCITFNRTEVFIDAISGLEINNRQQIHYYPREINDQGLSEVLTHGAKWVRDETDAENEESEAFRDCVVSGIGVTRSRMDYAEDPKGKFLEERVDPLNIWFDPGARKKCLSDRRYTFHGEYMDREEAHEKWPDQVLPKDAPDLEASPINTDRNWLYKDEEANIFESKDQVFILYYEECRKEDYYVALNPLTNQLEEITTEQFSSLKKLGLKHVKKQRNVYYRTFCNADGEPLEEIEKSPIQDFTYKFMTYKRDRAKNAWYGLVRHMKDPQRWANKWLSQILHIVNSNAKGGAFAEVTAFVDPKKAEEQWATTSPLILLKEGAIDKVRERQPSPYPSGLDRLMMLAFDSLPMVTGLNLEILGLADRDQAGVLEQQRRESAFAILAPVFASKRQYLKDQGRLTLKFIREFFVDRLARVIGNNGIAQYIPLVMDQDVDCYDVIIDQSPDSPDFKKDLWDRLQTMLPAMMKAGYPIPPSVIKFIPGLPMDLAQEWMQFVEQSQQGPSPEQMQQMQELVQKSQEEIQALKEENMRMKMDGTIDMMKMQQKATEAEVKAGLKMKEIEAESFNRQVEISMEAQIERASLALEAKMKMLQAIFDNQIKIFQAEMKASIDSQKLDVEKEKKPPITVNVDTKSDIKGMIEDHVKTMEGVVTPVVEKMRGIETKMGDIEKQGKKKTKRRVKRVADGYEIEDL
jgi:hypothetical protein